MTFEVIVVNISQIRGIWETRVKKYRDRCKKEKERLETSALQKIKQEWSFMLECRNKGIPQSEYLKNGFVDTPLEILDTHLRNSSISKWSASKEEEPETSKFIFSLCGSEWQELPDYLKEQTYLKEWHINKTLIHTIPDYIQTFEDMNVLDMSQNKISSLPPEIGENDREYKELIRKFVDWCQRNHLRINAGKTKEMVMDFRKHSPPSQPVVIHGTDIEAVKSYKYLGVLLNNKLEWAENINALHRRGQSRLHLLRRLRAFGVRGALLKTFFNSVVAPAIFFGIVCWGSSISARERSRLDKLIRKASSVLGGPLDTVQVVAERRTLCKLKSILENSSHPLHETVVALGSIFSDRLLHPKCERERYRKSFLPAAIRLFNKQGPNRSNLLPPPNQSLQVPSTD
ncbi:leucine-rich repeat-containing protein 2 isoform X1 [Engystomops pustulosus]|uniref:leucine-rich repeat-containing protein 2 isoform X1 n=1 Tax=Engystomops pustulosus TaxID=76066 RepID=UPI003AFA7DFD